MGSQQSTNQLSVPIAAFLLQCSTRVQQPITLLPNGSYSAVPISAMAIRIDYPCAAAADLSALRRRVMSIAAAAGLNTWRAADLVTAENLAWIASHVNARQGLGRNPNIIRSWSTAEVESAIVDSVRMLVLELN